MKPSIPSLAYIVAGSGAISGVVNGKTFSIQKDFPNYSAVKLAINERDADKVEDLINVGTALSKFSKGVCKVENGEVTYNGRPVANALTTRILILMREGFSVDPWLRFMENCLLNPSTVAIDELNLFLEANAIPMTEDGCFLAYKRVDKNLKSKHSNPDGTHEDHSIGKTPSMPREQVDPDRNTTCSRGLHFCSLSYLPNYGSAGNGDRIVIVKVNPADVVAIPSDYSNAKGRAWTYEVVGEHLGDDKTEAFSEPVYSTDAAVYGTKPSGQRFWSVRDEKTGQFTKRS